VLRSDIKWFHRDITLQTNNYTDRGAFKCLLHSNWCNSNWFCHMHKFKDRVGHFAKQVAAAGCKDFDMNPGMQVKICISSTS